ncbi:MAG TPA: division/cell wall cluster transcriptional repressor MraZ [Acidimicrobiia bacterium]|nr:division/cell wall cluster transcriptional repressor MraZ [Acidimicrobiia bacterium]
MATSFIGRYQHTLDDKGRLILPADFRKALEDGAYIGQFPGGCLAIYTPERFSEVSEDISQSAKEGGTKAAVHASRVFFASAQSVTPDKQGRVPVAPYLREWAHLDREVIVTGQDKRIELWSPQSWQQVEREGQAELARRQSWGI